MNMKPYILLSLLYYIMLQAIPLFKMKHKFSIDEFIDGMKLENRTLGCSTLASKCHNTWPDLDVLVWGSHIHHMNCNFAFQTLKLTL